MDVRSLRIAKWNANGLPNHKLELMKFTRDNTTDVLLVSKTHFTDQSVLKIPNYSVYPRNHPDGTAHEGEAISFVMPYNITKSPLTKQTKYKLLLSKLKHSPGLLTFRHHASYIYIGQTYRSSPQYFFYIFSQ